MINKKIAVYAGTFDPITNGHRDIILRAAGVFPNLVVAVVKNSNKNTLISAEKRAELIRKTIETFPKELKSKIKVSTFDGLLVDYVKSIKSNIIIRGLRAVSDYEYEAQMAVINRNLSSSIETVFFMTSEETSFISSSVVREVAKLGGDVSTLVPKPVFQELKKIFSKKS
ncbi:MAG: pantetheine-phosphate adenylyltransferase [Proteobacteria bacterium]|nr:pantetheine-phosphate adenylyltransferase [Pseudomonadota bacterium]